MNAPLVLDHIAVTARSLDEGAAHVLDTLGIEMPPGGAHPLMGTHNLLLALGPELFLEVIAVDPDAAVSRPRWFGLDHFDALPRLGTWVLATDDLETTLAGLPLSLGPSTTITRGALEWQLSVPEDGSMPMGGTFPSIIHWPEGSPAPAMTDLGCRLRRLTVADPDADQIRAALDSKFNDSRVEIVVSPQKRITAEIETPAGPRTLG